MSENNQINFSDFNALALEEFIKIIKSNEELDPQWKETIIELAKNGIPDDLSSLEAIIRGQNDVEN
jgi:hypothetical protein